MLKKIRGKKAMFFTLIALVLISLFLLSFTLYSAVNEKKSITKRIETMESFLFSLEKDMSRQNYISGYRAILSLEEEITSSGKFLNDSKAAIGEALINGTVNEQAAPLMEGYRLQDWDSRVAGLAALMSLKVNYTILNAAISQDSPWEVKIEMNISLFLQDQGNLASWNRTEIISSYVGIEGFEDPLYLISTNGKVTNRINKTVYMPFVSGNDVSNLLLHNSEMLYIASDDSPSFLDRLEGKTPANSFGIESLVYLPKLSSQGEPVKDKSVVDHVYFSSANPASHHIQGMPSWFKLDDSHLSAYGVSGLTSD
jgi:hypothetical protein